MRADNEYISYMNADLSADPSEVRFPEVLDKYRVVTGSRVLAPVKRPMVRSVFSYLYSIAFRMLSRLHILVARWT